MTEKKKIILTPYSDYNAGYGSIFFIFCYNKKWGGKHMMNKKKLCIIIVIAIIVTGLAVTFAVLSKSGKHKEKC